MRTQVRDADEFGEQIEQLIRIALENDVNPYELEDRLEANSNSMELHVKYMTEFDSADEMAKELMDQY